MVLPYINMNLPRCTRVPHPEPPSHLPPHTIPLGHPSAPAPSFLYPASNLDWRFVSYIILYMFQCHSPKSSHPLPLPQSPKHCSIHLCFFCCLTYRVIVTILILCRPLLLLPSVFPMNIQDSFPLGLTSLISLQCKGLSRLFQHHSSKASILWH